MHPETSLSARTATEQRLDPQRLQMLHLLAMGREEMETYLERVLVENPVLDEESEGPDFAPWDGAFEQASSGEGRGERAGGPERGDPTAGLIAAPTSWREDLLQQIRLLSSAEVERLLVGRLVLELDDEGFLRTPVEELRRRWSVSRARFEAALVVLHSLEPPGIGARSLEESLWLQWMRRYGDEDRLAETARKLIDGGLPDVPTRPPQELARRLRVPEGELRQVLARLQHLRPVPVDPDLEPIPLVRPDVAVRLDGEEVVVELLRRRSNLTLRSDYLSMLEQRDLDAQTRAYLAERIREARTVLEGLRRRDLTLYRATHALFTVQKAFLVEGVAALRPLRREDLASELGVHATTIGRALTGKFVATPRGVHSFDLFFPRGLEGCPDGSGEAVSAAWVREWIRRTVGEEDPVRPRSDVALARQLGELGIRIARRTVAKYREELGLPDSRRRRAAAQAAAAWGRGGSVRTPSRPETR